MRKISDRLDPPKKIIVYGYRRCGSTLFIKLMERALEQLDINPIMLKEFFANQFMFQEKISLVRDNPNYFFLMKIFVFDFRTQNTHQNLLNLLSDPNNIVVHLTRKNKYEGLISALRKCMSHNTFGNFFHVDKLTFDPNNSEHRRYVDESMNDILNEHRYVTDNMVKIYFEDFIKDPVSYIGQFVEYRKPLDIPLEKQINNYNDVFDNYDVLHEYIENNYGLTKDDLINYKK